MWYLFQICPHCCRSIFLLLVELTHAITGGGDKGRRIRLTRQSKLFLDVFFFHFFNYIHLFPFPCFTKQQKIIHHCHCLTPTNKPPLYSASYMFLPSYGYMIIYDYSRKKLHNMDTRFQNLQKIIAILRGEQKNQHQQDLVLKDHRDYFSRELQPRSCSSRVKTTVLWLTFHLSLELPDTSSISRNAPHCLPFLHCLISILIRSDSFWYVEISRCPDLQHFVGFYFTACFSHLLPLWKRLCPTLFFV